MAMEKSTETVMRFFLGEDWVKKLLLSCIDLKYFISSTVMITSSMKIPVKFTTCKTNCLYNKFDKENSFLEIFKSIFFHLYIKGEKYLHLTQAFLWDSRDKLLGDRSPSYILKWDQRTPRTSKKRLRFLTLCVSSSCRLRSRKPSNFSRTRCAY